MEGKKFVRRLRMSIFRSIRKMVHHKQERKRGKKKRGYQHTEEDPSEQQNADLDITADPSISASHAPTWIVDKVPKADVSAPFGLVDPDLKAYLRSAHTRLQELVSGVVDSARILEEDEDTKTMRNAMLDEIKGKELVLATDMDTSLILEDLLPTFGERQTRILADALSKE